MVHIFIITLYTKVLKKKVAPAARKKTRAGARGSEEANVFPWREMLMAWAWHTEVGCHEAQGSTAFADAVGLLGGKFPFKATGGRRSQYEAQGRSWL